VLCHSARVSSLLTTRYEKPIWIVVCTDVAKNARTASFQQSAMVTHPLQGSALPHQFVVWVCKSVELSIRLGKCDDGLHVQYLNHGHAELFGERF
jgi:hypothetical protein